MTEHPAGWYNDPYGRFQQRHWDGNRWTERVATGGVAQVDPLGDSTVVPFAIPSTATATAMPAVAAAATAGAGQPAPRGVIAFLDSLGPDARVRPRPGLRTAMAGLGGAVLAVGVLVAAGGERPSRGALTAVAAGLVAAAMVVRLFVGVEEAKAAAVGMVVVGIPTLATALTVDNNQGGFLTGLIAATLFIGAWALPGFKSRNLLLGLGAIALVGALGSLSAADNGDIARCDRFLSEGDFDSYDSQCQFVYQDVDSSFLPAGLTDNLGTQGIIYLAGAGTLLGLTWWLDRRGYHGAATGLCAAGLAAALVGTILLGNEFGTQAGPILTLVVGMLICVVGTHGSRRSTTWWGAALAALGLISLVALQWDPQSNAAIGGVAIVSGFALVGIALLSTPLRAAFTRRDDGSAGSPPPPPAFDPPTG